MHEFEAAVERERLRIIGKLLAAVGIYRLSGHEHIANAIDRLAMEIECEPMINALKNRSLKPYREPE